MMPGMFPMMVVTLAKIAKKPITSDDVRYVATDNNHTPNKSKCCLIVNQNMSCIVYVVVARNLQSQIHPAH